MVVRDLMIELDKMPQDMDVVIRVGDKIGGEHAGFYDVDKVDLDADGDVVLRISE